MGSVSEAARNFGSWVRCPMLNVRVRVRRVSPRSKVRCEMFGGWSRPRYVRCALFGPRLLVCFFWMGFALPDKPRFLCARICDSSSCFASSVPHGSRTQMLHGNAACLVECHLKARLAKDRLPSRYKQVVLQASLSKTLRSRRTTVEKNNNRRQQP